MTYLYMVRTLLLKIGEVLSLIKVVSVKNVKISVMPNLQIKVVKNVENIVDAKSTNKNEISEIITLLLRLKKFAKKY